MKAHIAQCESNCFSAHTNKTDVVGVRGRCASCTGLNQLFKQLRANDVITNTDLQALSAPSAATGHIFILIHLIIFVGRYFHCALRPRCVYLFLSCVYIPINCHNASYLLCEFLWGLCQSCCVTHLWCVSTVNQVIRSAPGIPTVSYKLCSGLIQY